MIATSKNLYPILRLLHMYGARHDQQNSCGHTVLHIAAMQEATECLRYIVEHEPRLMGVRSRNGKMPIHLAAKAGFVDGLKLLLDADNEESVLIPDTEGQIPLHLVCQSSSLSSLQLLTTHPQSRFSPTMLYTSSKASMLPHHYASQTGSLRILQHLHKIITQYHSKDQKAVEEWINKQDIQGFTALHYAAREGHEEVVGWLVGVGCDGDVRDGRGRRAVDVAREWGRVGTLEKM